MMEIDENETSKGDGEKAQEDKPVSKRRLLKKVVIGTAAAAVVGIGAALILKNGLKTSALQPNAAKAVAKTLTDSTLSSAAQTTADGASNATAVATKTVNVSQHIRNLHEGWTASADAVKQAQAAGVELGIGQTFVNAYSKTYSAAA
ncbi:MAG: hypothetical protein Q4Q56_03335 [Coriobacteriia bacterium]|nr:hypothetical protein [Coriobacteriia bacterium]